MFPIFFIATILIFRAAAVHSHFSVALEHHHARSVRFEAYSFLDSISPIAHRRISGLGQFD
jgi:hypothetical protein